VQLGQLLVHGGIITAGQLEEALRRQAVYGGRLGTNLFELGYANVDAVSQGLARLHRVPAALARHFDRHDPAAIELIPRDLAAEAVAIPLAFSRTGEQRRLVVCMRDPGDREMIARLRQAAQLELVVCVAAEVVLYYWLERRYGVARERENVSVQPGTATPLPRLTSEFPLETESDDSVDIDMDDADGEIEMPAELRLVELDHSDVERDQSQYGFGKDKGLIRLLERVDRDAAGTPDEAAERAPDLAAAARGAAEVKDEAAILARGIAAAARRHAARPAPLPRSLTAAQAIEAISHAKDREAIADAVFAFMRGAFGGCLILVAKEALALGYRGYGGSFDAASVQSLVIPLTVPSLFRDAFESASAYRGPPHPNGGALQDRFFKLFRLDAPPDEVAVVPVAIKDRVVWLFYGHGRDCATVDVRAFEELAQTAHASSEAFVRLIKEAKKRRAE